MATGGRTQPRDGDDAPLEVERERQHWRSSLLTGLLWTVAFALTVTSLFVVATPTLHSVAPPFLAATVVAIVPLVATAMPFGARTALLLLGIYAACTTSLLTVGLAPNALAGLMTISLISTLLLGRSWGLASLVVSTGTLLVILVAGAAGPPPTLSPWRDAFDPSAPLTQLRFTSVFAAVSAIVVFATSHVLEHAEGLLRRNARALSALEAEVAERERLRESLERHRAAVRRAEELELIVRVAGFAAHDVNNALQLIRCATEILHHHPPGDDDGVEAVRSIEEATRQAAATAAQLTAFGRHNRAPAQRVDVRTQLDKTVHMLTQVLPPTISIRLETRAEAAIVCDETMLQRSLVNLALNARDAMPNGGALTFTLRVAAADEVSRFDAGTPVVAVDVADTGVGIPAGQLDRVFEPFYTTKGEKGSGLGLASVLDFVRAQGGDVVTKSEPGKGTTFTLLWRSERS